METARVNDTEIAYEVIGHGEPLLLIHGSNLATGLVPIAGALADKEPPLQLVRYHRRGMGGSGGRTWPIPVRQQAADAIGLLDALGLPSAHVLGYSYGGVIALETALSSPTRVRSLTLLEPILAQVPSGPGFLAGMDPIVSLYDAGDMEGAVTATFAGMGGHRWPDLVAATGPGALERAVRDTELFYRDEFPVLKAWRLDAARAAAVKSPVLSVMGTRSGPFFDEGRQLLHRHFPQCVDVDIADANHLLNLQTPEPIAAAIADFLRQSVHVER
ncbi:alpha/beta hydrolase [Yinghuangia aomiensis]|uniref:Alpha/beta hydrolase n=2 Tax=Yinghuangia aomiensis TaxID=676205 RepID=A0ABP9HCD6_9ACTN